MIIQAEAPNRVDLAGGTLDIYPLYLFEGGGLTVNLALSVYSRTTLRPRRGRGVLLRSEDLALTRRAPSAERLRLGGPLDLVARAVRWLRPAGGVEVVTSNEAPRGSGLGASSALLVTLCAALARLNGARLTPTALVDLCANLEAQSLGVPTGKQDYCAALHGGVNAIRFDVDGVRVERLALPPATRRALEHRLLLSYTGIPHASGATNWGLVKGYIDRQPATVRHLRAIKTIATAMREALLVGDLDRVGALLGEEWEHRRRLGPGVSTPQIDRMMAAARRAGALASKLCGAGGGGCMVTLARQGRRDAVAAALAR
ncbi:MAG: GHMP kinase, partial [Deltaproteobacteria bacterium]|nr:GHMP kinase [Deltaproteobacteria bacterium]